MKTLQKGFTLIELLVVIAIIGILSSIVLASLSSARSKGSDAAITSTLSNMRAQAELYYSNTGSYGDTTASCTSGTSIFTASIGLLSLTTDLIAKAPATSVVCAASSTAWAVKANLASAPTTGSACADSSGVSVSSSTKIYVATSGSCQ